MRLAAASQELIRRSSFGRVFWQLFERKVPHYSVLVLWSVFMGWVVIPCHFEFPLLLTSLKCVLSEVFIRAIHAHSFLV